MRLRGAHRHLFLAPIGHKADASKAEDHHGPGGRFGYGSDRKVAKAATSKVRNSVWLGIRGKSVVTVQTPIQVNCVTIVYRETNTFKIDKPAKRITADERIK